MKVAVVGAGRVGTAMAVLLQRAGGYPIVGVSGRGPTRDRAARFLPDVPVLDSAEAARRAELVLVAVPDDVIALVVDAMAADEAFRPGQWVGHVSGATGLEALDAARDLGAQRLSVHPLQTFPDVGHAIDHIPGSTIAVTADDEAGYVVAERLATYLLGEPFRLPDDLRPLYHAAAVFASNYLVTTSSVAADLFRASGVPDPMEAMHPLQRATLDNLSSIGPEQALTGPVVRGDAGTVERNLDALREHAPHVVPAYLAMAEATLELAVRSGRLSDAQRGSVQDVLARWS